MLVPRYYRRNLNGISFSLPKYLLYQLSCSISDQFTSDLMKAANDIRHTLFGAFSPTQNVTNKLRTSLGRVRYAKVSLLGVESLWGDCTFIPVDWGSQQQICAILLFLKTFHYKNDKKCRSISIFFLKNNNIIFFLLLHKNQNPGINMQNGCQVI